LPRRIIRYIASLKLWALFPNKDFIGKIKQVGDIHLGIKPLMKKTIGPIEGQKLKFYASKT